MGLAAERAEPRDGGKVWKLFRMPFWQAGASSAAAVSHRHVSHDRDARAAEGSDTQYPTSRGVGGGGGSVSSVAKSLLPPRRRLRLDPSSKLYFPCEFSSLDFVFRREQIADFGSTRVNVIFGLKRTELCVEGGRF